MIFAIIAVIGAAAIALVVHDKGGRRRGRSWWWKEVKAATILSTVAVALVWFVVAAIVKGQHPTPSYCEQQWQANETTASIPSLPDNGHASYLTNCKAGLQYAHDLGTNP